MGQVLVEVTKEVSGRSSGPLLTGEFLAAETPALARHRGERWRDCAAQGRLGFHLCGFHHADRQCAGSCPGRDAYHLAQFRKHTPGEVLPAWTSRGLGGPPASDEAPAQQARAAAPAAGPMAQVHALASEVGFDVARGPAASPGQPPALAGHVPFQVLPLDGPPGGPGSLAAHADAGELHERLSGPPAWHRFLAVGPARGRTRGQP